MEILGLVAVLAIFFSGGKTHETPQNEPYKVPRAVLQDRRADARKEHCGEPDARWYPSVIDAVPKTDHGQQERLR